MNVSTWRSDGRRGRTSAAETTSLTVRRQEIACQVDGSWATNDEWTGMGFVLLEADEAILQGQLCTRRAQSPLHAEAEGIIWAMKEVPDRGLNDINFAMDCQQLTNLVCREEEWPTLASELDEIKSM
ncbi:hypothetical protein Bca101_005530 [Brassica carinata]